MPTPIAIVQRHDPAAEAKPKDLPPHSHSAAPAAPPAAAPASPGDDPQPEEATLRMIRQPETRPISANQLIAEVKGIYAGLIMVEAKCCGVVARQHQAALESDSEMP